MAGIHSPANRAGSVPRMEAPFSADAPPRSFQEVVASMPLHSKTPHGFPRHPTNLSFKGSQFLSMRPPSAVPPGPVVSSWEQQAPRQDPTLAAAASEQQRLGSEGGLLSQFGSGPPPSLLHLPSGEVGGLCGLGGSSAPPREIIPANLHALIPSKFKYKFPRDRIPRHKCYEVLAVEDNPYGPPPFLATPPPKKPHKKKSIFGIAKRVQQQPPLHAKSRFLASAASGAPSMSGTLLREPAAEAAGEAAAGGPRGWVCDLKCFLCTSPDFVSQEQATLERENAQLDEALAEFQEATRVQAIELLETKKNYEEKLKDNMRAKQEAADDVAATKAALQEIQAERDKLLELQRQTEQSLSLIRQRLGAGLDALYHSENKRSDELVEKMKHFCLGVTQLLDKALPAGERISLFSHVFSFSYSFASNSASKATLVLQREEWHSDKQMRTHIYKAAKQGVAVALEEVGPPQTPPARSRQSKKKALKKKKGNKTVVKKKLKTRAAGARPKSKGKRTKVKRESMQSSSGPSAAPRGSPQQQVSAAAAAALHASTTPERVANTGLHAAPTPVALPLQQTGNNQQGQGKEVGQLYIASSPAPAAAAAAPEAAAGSGKLQLVLYPGMSEKNARTPDGKQQDKAALLLKQRLDAVNQKQQQQQEAGKQAPLLRRSFSADRKPASPSPLPIRRASSWARLASVKTPASSSSFSSISSTAKRAAAGSPKSKGKEAPLRAAATFPLRKREAAAEEVEARASPLGLRASSAVLEKGFLPAGGKSLGRLWTLKAPPPLPPGLVSKLREHAEAQGHMPLLVRGITTAVGSA
ncbi:hypothetical protein Esti_004045 [Eimeria stiedai]